MVIQSDLLSNQELNYQRLAHHSEEAMRSRAIEAYKQSLKLTRRQRETLVGILLGDACLETRNRGRTYRLKIEQSARHESYLRHLYRLFEPWVLTQPRQRLVRASNGAVSVSWVFQTVSHAAFRFYARQFYVDGKKRVPELIHRWLTPRGLAFWFMDDGSIKSNQSKGVVFNTQGFDSLDVERLIDVLENKFSLHAITRRQRDGTQVYVSGISGCLFLEIVDRYVISDMRYKLPMARRTQMPKK